MGDGSERHWRLYHPRYSVEPCPRCEHPEADGGYCNPEDGGCGWTMAHHKREQWINGDLGK